MKLVELPTLYFDPLLHRGEESVWVPVLLLVSRLLKSSSILRLQLAESLGRILFILDFSSPTVDTNYLRTGVDFLAIRCPIWDAEKIQISN